MGRIISSAENMASSLWVNQFSRHGLRRFIGYRFMGSALETSSAVASALKNREPIVALESTIITHGMPYPANLETALRVEEIVRSQVGCMSAII